MNINWHKLELEKKTSADLQEIRRRSYYRYDPPNLHGIWFMFGLTIIIITTMLLFHPNPITKTNAIVMFVIGFISIFIYTKKVSRARKRWEEMEGIRDQIDQEFKRRDDILGLK